jgi:cytochrome b subunit of formate dehydrogenase
MPDSHNPSQRFLRFTISDRVEHLAQMLTFVVLAATGLVQKWPENGLSGGVIEILGGIESVRVIHRVAATILMVAVVYHLGAIGYRRFVLQQPRSMAPTRADARNLLQSVRYAIGSREAPPQQARFTWEEKAVYWSYLVSTGLVIVTGFALWNPIATTQLLPGQFIPAAKSAHGNEALLAVLAIVLWHFFHVHVRHWNTSIWTGYMTRAEMERYHPMELAARDDGQVSPGKEERRALANRYFSIFGAAAAAFLVGIFFFITFEETAIETVEPIEDVVAFSPMTTTTAPPVTTTEATTTTTVEAGLSWSTFSEAFAGTCGACHGDSGGMGGLSLTSYAGAVAGGGSGTGIVPGDPDGSAIVVKMEGGGHPAQLDADLLAMLREWITAGAPEL